MTHQDENYISMRFPMVQFATREPRDPFELIWTMVGWPNDRRDFLTSLAVARGAAQIGSRFGVPKLFMVM